MPSVCAARIWFRAVTASRNQTSWRKFSLVEIAEVRIEGVAVEIDVFFGIARADPGFLHGDALVGQLPAEACLSSAARPSRSRSCRWHR